MTVRWRGRDRPAKYSTWVDVCYLPFSSNDFVTSAALAEVCTLLSVVLVFLLHAFFFDLLNHDDFDDCDDDGNCAAQ